MVALCACGRSYGDGILFVLLSFLSFQYKMKINIKPPKTYAFLGLSKGVGFIRFDQRCEAERAIKELNGTIPKNSTEAITVKFANNPSNNKAMAPLAAYLTPQTARRFPGPIHHTTGRFRYNTNGFEHFSTYCHSDAMNCLSNWLIFQVSPLLDIRH